jgi:hypothetical protein
MQFWHFVRWYACVNGYTLMGYSRTLDSHLIYSCSDLLSLTYHHLVAVYEAERPGSARNYTMPHPTMRVVTTKDYLLICHHHVAAYEAGAQSTSRQRVKMPPCHWRTNDQESKSDVEQRYPEWTSKYAQVRVSWWVFFYTSVYVHPNEELTKWELCGKVR